jgi:hypothetical protein
MTLRSAALATITSKRVWLWEIAGSIIYLIPVAIRFATGNIAIPVLNFPGFWIGNFIPGNLLEKILVNAFFPGGAGGIAGETFVRKYQNKELKGKSKYLSRLAGALIQTSVWTTVQYVGYNLMINGPYGSNIFEFATVFPINFTLAAFSIFTPEVMSFAKTKLIAIKHFKRSANEKSNSIHFQCDQICRLMCNTLKLNES